MAAVVSLQEVVEELDLIGGELKAFLNRKTGELYEATDESLWMAEDDDDNDDDDEVDPLAEEDEVAQKLREIIASPDWIQLPDRQSHDDYRIMERFCLEKCAGETQEKLMSAIQGRGAFRRFKDAINWEGVQESWYAFRKEWLTQEARDWLDAMGIEYKEV